MKLVILKGVLYIHSFITRIYIVPLQGDFSVLSALDPSTDKEDSFEMHIERVRGDPVGQRQRKHGVKH